MFVQVEASAKKKKKEQAWSETYQKEQQVPKPPRRPLLFENIRKHFARGRSNEPPKEDD
jgi:hypothetical protein